jgi:hypothetical protein
MCMTDLYDYSMDHIYMHIYARVGMHTYTYLFICIYISLPLLEHSAIYVYISTII